jgi:hypothetical protein
MLVSCAGSRGLSKAWRYFVEAVGALYAEQGATLVCGGAVGADQAFQLGAVTLQGKVVVYLPWASYEKHFHADGFWPPDQIHTADAATPHHWQLAQQCHPAWYSLSAPVKKLMVRNAMIVDPFEGRPDVLLALPNRSKLGWGGTGHTIRCAMQLNVPIFLLDAWRSYP